MNCATCGHTEVGHTKVPYTYVHSYPFYDAPRGCSAVIYVMPTPGTSEAHFSYPCGCSAFRRPS